MFFRIIFRPFIAAALMLGALTSAFAEAPSRTVELQVDGLVCAFCAQGISKKLGKLPATEDVLVSLEQGLVAVALKPGQDIDDAELRELLTESGYTVRAIERRDETLDAVRARIGENS